MIVDGRAIAGDIKRKLKKEVAGRHEAPKLFIFSVGENPVSARFMKVKERFAEAIGVPVEQRGFPETFETLYLIGEITKISKSKNCGIVVQLPLPDSTDTTKVLDAIPARLDPDMLSTHSQRMYKNGRIPIVPPVVGAIKEILARNSVFLNKKNVLIVGRGRLVGAPAEVWFGRHGGEVTVIDERVSDLASFTTQADIIVSGAGAAGIITPDIVKAGVVLFDAGTSESNGRIVGDIDPSCAQKADVFTPVPGGIGPITVAKLFENLLALTRET